MKNLNSHDRLQFLTHSVPGSSAVCAAKKILAVVKGRRLAAAAIVAAICSVSVAAVLTPSSGILSAPVLARASFADPTDLKFKVKGQSQEVINVNNLWATYFDVPAGEAFRIDVPNPGNCSF
jgi:hypothetical protein